MTQNLSAAQRYSAYRTRRFVANEQKWSKMLPKWRSLRKRRILIRALIATFVFMFAVGVVCAFGVVWAPLLWLPACLVFFPLWSAIQIVSGRQGDAPTETLDELEVQQRNEARSVGLTVTQTLVLIPIFYLIFGSVITNGDNESMAYAGGIMALTTLLFGGCTPAMILGWTRPDDCEDSE